MTAFNMTADAPFSLHNYVPFLLNRAATKIAAAFSATLKEHGLSIVSWRLLAALYQHESLRVGELADFTAIELWTVSRTVARLEEQNFVTRQREGKDSRAVTVTLTPLGRQLMDDLLPEAQKHEELPLGDFNPEEQQLLRKLLQRVYKNTMSMPTESPSESPSESGDKAV